VHAKAARELAYPLNRFVAALADDVRCAELFCERDAIGMPAEHDDLSAPSRRAAMTPHNPTAPSPTMATVFPLRTFAVTAA
jgi:hypothetical protein